MHESLEALRALLESAATTPNPTRPTPNPTPHSAVAASGGSAVEGSMTGLGGDGVLGNPSPNPNPNPNPNPHLNPYPNPNPNPNP